MSPDETSYMTNCIFILAFIMAETVNYICYKIKDLFNSYVTVTHNYVQCIIHCCSHNVISTVIRITHVYVRVTIMYNIVISCILTNITKVIQL